MSTIDGTIQQAWDFTWNRLFYGKTNLFYDCLVSDDPDGAVCHQPPPETIRLQVPNPCGWGSGMEDG
ncbi:MAG: hypothetical protein LBP26_03635, partial [Clostridiales bacterium]|nr:hypothetical protein [Clostridiales bacterium]